MKIAKVIVDVPSSAINQTFDYLIPDHLSDVLEPGMRVIVPFGPRKIMGYVIERVAESDFTSLKEIIDVLDLLPVLTKELLDLGKWLADKTLSLYVTTYQAMLPQVLKSQYEKELIRLTDDRLEPDLETFFAGRDVVAYEELTSRSIRYSQVQSALQAGDIMVNYIVKSNVTKKHVTKISPLKSAHLLEEAVQDLHKNAVKQRTILEFFIDHPEQIEQKQLLKQLNTTPATLRKLEEDGLLKKQRVEVFRNPYDDAKIVRTEALPLMDEQARAIQPIKQHIHAYKHDVFLLHGVTGSGKTEVYLQAIQSVVDQGREAIVLVPEISLTPQMVHRFKGRFGANVAVMHSGLSSGEKYDEWRKIQRKEVQVVVGARSAIFAPFENIGIMIIDEEHETSYKQEDQPRYHARDVAIERGKYHHCPVVLGSATPALESYARAEKGVYQLGTLAKRTNDKGMPGVEIVDMREELHAGNRTMFSRRLKDLIEACLANKEQVVLLLNRRGYSTFVMCRDCGYVKECPHCDIALTYHKNTNQLKCHYCSYEEPMPSVCPECQSDLIRYFGTGTQRVEESLTQLLPDARVIRMDVDTTRRKGAHERLLTKFANQEADILLGTQMIAKGLDFENVTLVGVLAADSMLHLPDFRSAEKTFQLMTQVSGRAGRHELPGNVIVQSYTPDHYSIKLASQYDYLQFYRTEMQMRKTFQYPPYMYLALITITHANQVTVIKTTQAIVQMLQGLVNERTVILGPTPSPITRVKDRYRYQCMVKYKHEPRIEQLIQHVIEQFKEDVRKNDLQIMVDMQPYQLM